MQQQSLRGTKRKRPLANVTIFHAAETGNIPLLRDIIAEFPSHVDMCDKYGNTPIFRATIKREEETVRMLVFEFGADVNKTETVTGFTPFYHAALSGFSEPARLLALECGADVDKAENVSGNTPLCTAAQCGYEKMAWLIALECGADVNKTNRHGRTPIYLAANNGYEAVVRLLAIECGADINKPDTHGFTPFLAASLSGHYSVVEFLVSIGTSCGPIYANIFPDKARWRAVEKGLRGRPFTLLRTALRDWLTPTWGEKGVVDIVADYAQYTFEDWDATPGCVPTLEEERGKVR